MILSQRTFAAIVLLLFGVYNVRCETEFKSGEQQFNNPFLFFNIKINTINFHVFVFHTFFPCEHTTITLYLSDHLTESFI